MKQSELKQQLKDQIDYCLNKAEQLSELAPSNLERRPSPDKWNTLEVLAHLNLYSDFYLIEFQKAVEKCSILKRDREYKPGFFGNKAARSMEIDDLGKPKNSMKTFKSKDTFKQRGLEGEVKRFLTQQREWRGLLDATDHLDLSSIRTATTLPLVRFKLGDTLRFVINHQIRHMAQIDRCLQQAEV